MVNEEIFVALLFAILVIALIHAYLNKTNRAGVFLDAALTLVNLLLMLAVAAFVAVDLLGGKIIPAQIVAGILVIFIGVMELLYWID